MLAMQPAKHGSSLPILAHTAPGQCLSINHRKLLLNHKFSIGQVVHAAGTHFAARTSGVYEVIRLMPESNGEFSYRIKKTASGTERAAGESQICAADAGHGVWAAAAVDH